MKKLFTLLPILLLLSCTTTVNLNKYLFINVSDNELSMRYTEYMGLNLDGTYTMPPREYVTKVLIPHLGYQSWSRYRTESNDCDDFAAKAQVIARERFSNDYPKAAATLAFFRVGYYPDTGGAHMINRVLLSDGTEIFIEPQLCREVKLSERELKTIILMF